MRADSFFTNLTKRQSMLLLTAVTFGGAESVEAFEHLAEEEAEILRERAEKLNAIPREQRIPFLVQEIKRLVVGRRGGDLRGADPAQVANALKGERPALAEVILRALPAQLAGQVRNELPPVSVKLSRELKPEILSVIRYHFEQQLKRLSPRGASFLFADLLTLTAKDLLTLADHLGAEDVAAAIAGLPDDDRDELLKSLPAEQRALAARAAASAAGRRLSPEAAVEALEAVSPGDRRHAVRHAGLRRLVRACLAESAEFASRLAERHRDELGRSLVAAIRSERNAGRPRGGERLKVEVVSRLEQLAERGLVERPQRLPPPPALRRAQGTSDPTPPVKPLPVPRPPGSRPSSSAAQPSARPSMERPASSPSRTSRSQEETADPPAPRPSGERPLARRTDRAREYPIVQVPDEQPKPRPSTGTRRPSRDDDEQG